MNYTFLNDAFPDTTNPTNPKASSNSSQNMASLFTPMMPSKAGSTTYLSKKDDNTRPYVPESYPKPSPSVPSSYTGIDTASPAAVPLTPVYLPDYSSSIAALQNQLIQLEQNFRAQNTANKTHYEQLLSSGSTSTTLPSCSMEVNKGKWLFVALGIFVFVIFVLLFQINRKLMTIVTAPRNLSSSPLGLRFY